MVLYCALYSDLVTHSLIDIKQSYKYRIGVLRIFRIENSYEKVDERMPGMIKKRMMR